MLFWQVNFQSDFHITYRPAEANTFLYSCIAGLKLIVNNCYPYRNFGGFNVFRRNGVLRYGETSSLFWGGLSQAKKRGQDSKSLPLKTFSTMQLIIVTTETRYLSSALTGQLQNPRNPYHPVYPKSIKTIRLIQSIQSSEFYILALPCPINKIPGIPIILFVPNLLKQSGLSSRSSHQSSILTWLF